ncbi:hypothetical protein GWK47_054216 [Chionoecetes opilio]|uniref:Uncharacterized protein n=1 Tax=Chionoecetes opilio TaxID=41210 RepID=A0A8J4Y0E6_CHIOP|nr:hypothetical protein GWK47_054216 [Chionoecetes opilio]
MDWVLGKVIDQSDCGASLGNTKITDLVFADVAVIFAESLEVLVMSLEALDEEAKPLGLEVSWLKTKVQVFGGFDEPRTNSYRGHQLYPPLQQDGGKEVESWCSEKQRNKLLEQAMFPALSDAAWLDVFVKYNTAIVHCSCGEIVLPGVGHHEGQVSEYMTSDNFETLVGLHEGEYGPAQDGSITNQSIIGGIRRGARRLAHPTTPLPGVTTREFPCRLLSHTKQLSTKNIKIYHQKTMNEESEVN